MDSFLICPCCNDKRWAANEAKGCPVDLEPCDGCAGTIAPCADAISPNNRFLKMNSLVKDIGKGCLSIVGKAIGIVVTGIIFVTLMSCVKPLAMFLKRVFG